MTKKNEEKVAEAKASAASLDENILGTENEQIFDSEMKEDTKTEEKNKDQWLEEELKDVEAESENDADDNNDVDALMKKAAEQLEQTRKELAEWKDSYVRLHAEWDTYRRRTAEQREQEKAIATEALVSDILPVLDDFERSISYAKENGEEGLLSGVEAVYAKLVSSLEKSGVEVLNPTDFEAFNALEHQAVATVENADVYNESVANVMQKGYKMGKKVIRPAMVGVTTGGKDRPKPKDEESEQE